MKNIIIKKKFENNYSQLNNWKEITLKNFLMVIFLAIIFSWIIIHCINKSWNILDII